MAVEISTDYLIGKKIDVIVNHPMGSRYLRGLIYPVNYGIVNESSVSLEAYILGEFKPIKEFTGRVIAVIHRKDIFENKLVVARSTQKYSKEAIIGLTEFQERFYDSEVICGAITSPKEGIQLQVLSLLRQNESILVSEDYDLISGEIFYRFPGGEVSFGEESGTALRRIMYQEFRDEITDAEYRCTIENFYVEYGIRYHQIIMVYEVKLPLYFYRNDPALYEKRYQWISTQQFVTGVKKIVPEGIEYYL
jgi:inorganic pyrophosphatase